MARIAGINIPNHQHTAIALTAIFGIGRSRARDACPQPPQSGLDGRRVVREIVIHRDLVDDAANFHAAFDAAECIQRPRGARRLHAYVPCRGDRRQSIHDIVLAEQRPVHLGHRPTLA